MTAAAPPLDRRVEALDWDAIAAGLNADGHAVTGPLLTPAECRAVSALYDRDAGFRSRIVMARHGFGQGEYKYFDHPLPDLIRILRASAYARLAPLANRWAERLGSGQHFPPDLEDLTERCHAAGQIRPTPLLLRYGPGDYNCLHQDVYGDLVFPIQLAVLLSEPGRDFTGGEFVLVEQRPRRQSRAHVVPLGLGEGVVFAVRDRPHQGTRGPYRVALRHGVSTIHSGHRCTLGIIFHDAA